MWYETQTMLNVIFYSASPSKGSNALYVITLIRAYYYYRQDACSVYTPVLKITQEDLEAFRPTRETC